MNKVEITLGTNLSDIIASEIELNENQKGIVKSYDSKTGKAIVEVIESSDDNLNQINS